MKTCNENKNYSHCSTEDKRSLFGFHSNLVSGQLLKCLKYLISPSPPVYILDYFNVQLAFNSVGWDIGSV